MAKEITVFVTAHPDDECMFFGPSMHYALKSSSSVHLICLSRGCYDDQSSVEATTTTSQQQQQNLTLGILRERELFDAAKQFGIQVDNVTCIHDERLLDGPKQTWSSNDVIEVLAEKLEDVLASSFRAGMDEITLNLITFDERGVSGHPNHCAICKALLDQNTLKTLKSLKYRIPINYRILTLQSIPLPVKFMSFLALPLIWMYYWAGWWSGPDKPIIIVSNVRQILTTLQAMSCHQSQMLWFRYLYLGFSSFIIFNVLWERSLINNL